MFFFYHLRSFLVLLFPLVSCYSLHLFPSLAPGGGGGVKSGMYPPYPQRDRKRGLNGAV